MIQEDPLFLFFCLEIKSKIQIQMKLRNYSNLFTDSILVHAVYQDKLFIKITILRIEK